MLRLLNVEELEGSSLMKFSHDEKPTYRAMRLRVYLEVVDELLITPKARLRVLGDTDALKLLFIS